MSKKIINRVLRIIKHSKHVRKHMEVQLEDFIIDNLDTAELWPGNNISIAKKVVLERNRSLWCVKYPDSNYGLSTTSNYRIVVSSYVSRLLTKKFTELVVKPSLDHHRKAILESIRKNELH